MELVLASGLQLILHLPMLAVWLIGIYLAVTRRAENPAAYRLVSIACVLFLVLSLVSTVLNVALPAMMVQSGTSAMQMGVVFAISNIIQMLVSIVAWVLILMALFGRRASVTPPEPYPRNVDTF